MKDMHSIIEQIAKCHLCPLWQTRINTVPGEGPIDANMMIIGEGPGEENDKTGRPFVGRGGVLLDKYLSTVGIDREKIYLTNIIKCRMPHNATPTPTIVKQCLKYLMEQIAIINPKVVVTLGLPASKVLLNASNKRLVDLHDQIFHRGSYDLICTYHPSSVRYNKAASQYIIDAVKKAQSLCTQETTYE